MEVEDNFKSRTRDGPRRSGPARGGAASTLRYDEKKGLIASLGPAGARRQFAPGVLDQLALIALRQAAGLSLDEIHTMLSPQGGPAIDRGLLAAKADEIDTTIRQLQAMSPRAAPRRGLRRAGAAAAQPCLRVSP